MAYTEQIETILIDAGCNTEFINKFQTMQKDSTLKEQITMLNLQRTKLLDNLHKYQKQIDCLDYLVYQLKKSQKEEGI